MGEFKACNAFQPSEEDKKKFGELSKIFKYHIWVPESVAAIGDIHLFYDDIKDFMGGIGWSCFYRWIKMNPQYVTENPQYYGKEVVVPHQLDELTLEQLFRRYWRFQEMGSQKGADEIIEYVKEKFERK
jgi:hypothetical protein